MRLSIPASPSRLARLRRAVRAHLGGVSDEVTDELRAGGRGLWLLRRLVDEVRLERVKLGTRVTLRRAIGPAGTLAR